MVKPDKLVVRNWENSRELVYCQDSQLEDNQMKIWPECGSFSCVF